MSGSRPPEQRKGFAGLVRVRIVPGPIRAAALLRFLPRDNLARRTMTIACSDCGAIEELAPLASRSLAFCPICDNKLEATSGRSITGALACSIGTLILLFPSNLVPILSVSMLGMQRSTLLGSGVVTLWNQNWIVLAAFIAAFAIVLPFIRFGLLTATLGAIHLGYRPWWLGRAFRWALWLDVWTMPDMFLIGCFVG